jgi:hypothetical protein
MFSTFCATGMTGWIAMVVVWAGVVALAIWAIARLFPVHTPAGDSGGESSHPSRVSPPAGRS